MRQEPYPDAPMSDEELRLAEVAFRCGDISATDLAWLMGLEDEQTDRPPPRGFKSWRHFDAFKWNMEQRRLGKPAKRTKRKRAA